MGIHRLLKKNRTKLCFRVGSVADLNAARGLVFVLGIRTNDLVVVFDREADRALARRAFPGAALREGGTPRRDELPVRFDTDGRFGLQGEEVVFRHDPYKYFLPKTGSKTRPEALRKALGIEQGRAVMVASLSTPQEIRELLKAYARLKLVPRPLLILGLRQLEPFLKGALSRMGLKAAWRISRGRPLSSLRRIDVVVLSTSGELFDFLRAAQLAILGHDRNLFEPATLGVPTLYFDGPLGISHPIKELVELFDLRWRKNRTALRLLKKTGGAVRISPASFAEQITRTLENPRPVIAGARESVRSLHEQVLPAARRQGIHFLAAALRSL